MSFDVHPQIIGELMATTPIITASALGISSTSYNGSQIGIANPSIPVSMDGIQIGAGVGLYSKDSMFDSDKNFRKGGLRLNNLSLIFSKNEFWAAISGHERLRFIEGDSLELRTLSDVNGVFVAHTLDVSVRSISFVAGYKFESLFLQDDILSIGYQYNSNYLNYDSVLRTTRTQYSDNTPSYKFGFRYEDLNLVTFTVYYDSGINHEGISNWTQPDAAEGFSDHGWNKIYFRLPARVIYGLGVHISTKTKIMVSAVDSKWSEFREMDSDQWDYLVGCKINFSPRLSGGMELSSSRKAWSSNLVTPNRFQTAYWVAGILDIKFQRSAIEIQVMDSHLSPDDIQRRWYLNLGYTFLFRGV